MKTTQHFAHFSCLSVLIAASMTASASAVSIAGWWESQLGAVNLVDIGGDTYSVRIGPIISVGQRVGDRYVFETGTAANPNVVQSILKLQPYPEYEVLVTCSSRTALAAIDSFENGQRRARHQFGIGRLAHGPILRYIPVDRLLS